MTSADTFQDYLKEPGHLTFDQMAAIHQEIVEEVGQDEEALEFYGYLVVAAAKYANTRALWCTMDKMEKMEKDSGRTSGHDSVITNLNMLARFLKTQGKPALWRDRLGDETDRYGRKALGDFACYLAFVCGINAR
ncbi:MAG: hypothetical protein LUF35_00545 [Lachnospiraceae bacterium]|nr:hypothetical protein [Lachnospiraceae bacterium]